MFHLFQTYVAFKCFMFHLFRHMLMLLSIILMGRRHWGVVIRVRDWDGNLKLTGWRVILHCRDVEEAQSQKKM
jgi:hypothetical protein